MKVGDLVRKNPKEWRKEDCEQFGIVTEIAHNIVYVTFLGEVWKSSYAEYELEVINESR
jgi:DNA-binding FadR family transcriptional regulator